LELNDPGDGLLIRAGGLRAPTARALRPSQFPAGTAESAQMIPAVTALRQRYGELATPVVIMAGTDDRYLDVRQQSAPLYREAPGSDFRVVSGICHMLHHVVPEQVMAAIDVGERRAQGRRPTGLKECPPKHRAGSRSGPSAPAILVTDVWTPASSNFFHRCALARALTSVP
jgi:hypothetical protein